MSPLRFATILTLAAVVACLPICASAQLPDARLAVALVDTPDRVPSDCSVTKPTDPPYMPPPPYDAELPNSWFWFGSDKLWINLPANGIWTLGHFRPTESSFRQKFLWYRKGYNAKTEPNPKLRVTGRRIDASAPPLQVDGPNGAWVGDVARSFMTVGLNFPTAGCWEVSGQYEQDKLSFIVWIEDGSVSTAPVPKPTVTAQISPDCRGDSVVRKVSFETTTGLSPEQRTRLMTLLLSQCIRRDDTIASEFSSAGS